jgi:lysyl-tRNA synthetase class 2
MVEANQEEGKKFLDEPTGEMVSKSELKKRQKAREAAAKKAAKDAEKAAK